MYRLKAAIIRLGTVFWCLQRVLGVLSRKEKKRPTQEVAYTLELRQDGAHGVGGQKLIEQLGGIVGFELHCVDRHRLVG